MAGDAALDIFPQIQSLVSDNLQVVSYKWLSRHFSVSSNCAKRLLQEFAEKHHSELEVLYTLSGWLKSNPQAYCIKLASSLKLAEAKKGFQDNCSVQVYSVQTCIPHDLAVLWNAEFVQAEELFNQPLTEENCLRDNRFCGVSNSFVKRILDSKSLTLPTSRPTVEMPTAGESIGGNFMKVQPDPLPHKSLVGQSSALHEMHPSNAVICEKSDKSASLIVERAIKPAFPKESTISGNTNKRKVHDEKTSMETAGSLASLWGRAKPKSTSPSETANLHPVPAGSAEAAIHVQEAVDAFSDEDEEHTIICKRESNSQRNRKRRVVLDFSDNDEEEDILSRVSPEPPNEKHDAGHTKEGLSMRRGNLDSEEQNGDTLKFRQADIEERNEGLLIEPDAGHESKNIGGGSSMLEKSDNHNKESSDTIMKDQAVNSSSTLPKGKKVLKTRIDDRGREVTEVTWEEPADSNENTKNNDAGNRSSTSNKTHIPPVNAAPSVSPATKGANKKPAKGGLKDVKKGNILSFFKRV